MVKLVFVVLFFGLATSLAFAAPQENTVQKCFDGRDNDRDGLIDGDDPDCDGVQPAPSIKHVVLVDSADTQIGGPDGHSQVWVTVEGQPAFMSLRANLTGLLSLVGFGQVYFTELDCEGDAYIETYVDSSPEDDDLFLRVYGSFDYGYYVNDPNATPTTLTLSSNFSSSRGHLVACENSPYNASFVAPLPVEIPHVPPVKFVVR